VPKNDSPAVSTWDIPLALVLLTRLPMPRLPSRVFARQSNAVWAFPLVGLVIGMIACSAGWVLSGLNQPPPIKAAIIMTLLIVTTGAMHEDGLADTADGFWGGFTRERRLEIMKDSHIGTYGVLALILSQLLRWGLITALIMTGIELALIAAAVWSRALMPTMMTALPNARGSGLSHGVGVPTPKTCVAGLLIGLGINGLLIGSSTLVPAVIAVLMVFGLALVAKAKIGGQTGDILGATQQISEISFLMAVLAVI
jgi:adenosylcobinamide-GDP ribazoletransferase